MVNHYERFTSDAAYLQESQALVHPPSSRRYFTLGKKLKNNLGDSAIDPYSMSIWHLLT